VREIVLKAMGQAISKTVAIAEILKVGILFKFSFSLSLPLRTNYYSCPETEENPQVASRYCH
jgi:hypothetical protein